MDHVPALGEGGLLDQCISAALFFGDRFGVFPNQPFLGDAFGTTLPYLIGPIGDEGASEDAGNPRGYGSLLIELIPLPPYLGDH